jgi:hypothetical protein
MLSGRSRGSLYGRPEQLLFGSRLLERGYVRGSADACAAREWFKLHYELFVPEHLLRQFAAVVGGFLRQSCELRFACLRLHMNDQAVF